MKKKILIISGGISKERLISLDTGLQVARELKNNGYKVKISEPDSSLARTIKKFKPKVIFNALHGKGGEDGVAQSYFEYLGIPYTHSGVVSSFNSMNKLISKQIFLKKKILTPKHFSINGHDYKISTLRKIIKKKNIKFPIVVKPVDEGSSLGVNICKNFESLISSSKKLFKRYDKIIFEKYIPGQEVQVAIINNKAIGAIELIPKRAFYDYKAKYTKGAKTKHIMPARLTKKSYNEVLRISKLAHNALGCRGVTRSDFKFYNNKFYLLELNTQPGMTNLSLVPEIANYCGINFNTIPLLQYLRPVGIGPSLNTCP